MTEAEREQQLVDAVRMLTQAEIIDYNGHCSIRTAPDRLLINSGRSVRSHLTTDDLVEIGLDGERIRGTDAPPLEYHIHAAIYRQRPDVGAVVHGHPKWSTYLSMVGEAFAPVYAQGTLLGEVPLFPNPLSVNTGAAGAALAQTLGAGRAVLLRSHGAVVVGADIVESFALALYLEDNAQRQYMARALGRPYVFTPEEQAACRENLWKRNLFQKAWDHQKARVA
ncbi:class II aldolase/adducin family protein [Roseomonas sp. BN140053]|uniref:class II aldolase/adducin family protein n=1 Tax=Roseomonas sp. BN140053 TaxID=3391898 RepID=UPI0039EA0A69